MVMAANVLSHPLTISSQNGGFKKVEQGTDLYKGQQISAFIRTHVGERPVFPSFGTDDPTFAEFRSDTFAEKFNGFYGSGSILLESIEVLEEAGSVSQINVTFT